MRQRPRLLSAIITVFSHIHDSLPSLNIRALCSFKRRVCTYHRLNAYLLGSYCLQQKCIDPRWQETKISSFFFNSHFQLLILKAKYFRSYPHYLSIPFLGKKSLQRIVKESASYLFTAPCGVCCYRVGQTLLPEQWRVKKSNFLNFDLQTPHSNKQKHLLKQLHVRPTKDRRFVWP